MGEKERHGLIKYIKRYLDGEDMEKRDDQGLLILQGLQEYMDGLITSTSTTSSTGTKPEVTFDLNGATAVLTRREL